MPPANFPLRWESTGDQWWFASPIDWAAANGHYDLVRQLIHLDTNLLIKLTSLRRIRRLETVWDDEEQFDDVAKCRAQVARQLLEECQSNKGCNPLIRSGYGGWLLYTAASAGDVIFVKELLDRDPLLVFGEGEYGVTDIFYAAARSKSCEVFRLLLDCSISPRCGEKQETVSSVFRWEMMNRAVHAVARGGSVEILKELVEDGSDVLGYRDGQGSTLLHTAAGRGQVEVAKHLIESYDIINSTDNQGNTALNVAAYRGHLAVVKLLLSASPSSALLVNNYGDTFLHMAVAGFRTPGFRRVDRQLELMKELVGGKLINVEDLVNTTNKDGRTALHMAIIENIQSDIVELLMSARYINLNIRDEDGNTPLDLLKLRPQSASSEILIKRLISAGGISNCQDHMTRNAIASHLRMHGIGGSPGTSFRIPDAEIFLYAGIEDGSEISCDLASSGYGYSGEIRPAHSRAESTSSNNKKSGSLNRATSRLKVLLRLARKKDDLEDNNSMESCRISSSFKNSPVPLRQKFSRISSLPNNKRILSMQNNFPSPTTKSRFAAGLREGVLQVMPESYTGSPSSPFSDLSWASPGSARKGKGKENRLDFGIEGVGTSGTIHSPDARKLKMKRKHASFNMRLMNNYFCFGAQGLAVDNSITSSHQSRSHKDVVV